MKKIAGTRDVIFDRSIELFSTCGYENVSMREIASEVGIKAASIYNHYVSKQEILDCIYEYFEKAISSKLPSFEKTKSVVRLGTAQEIIRAFTALLAIERDNSEGKRMMMMNKIVYSRFYIDPNSTRIVGSTMNNAIEYISKALNYGVEIGRFEPFDTQAFSRILVIQYMELNMETSLRTADAELPYPEVEKMISDFLSSILPEIKDREKPPTPAPETVLT